jgi:outer membrane scaffolding protein for murein synthesis (MipA/OmpV family)
VARPEVLGSAAKGHDHVGSRWLEPTGGHLVFRFLPLALLLAPLDLAAQAPAAPSDRPLLTGQVGVLGLAIPRYPGSAEHWVLPVPLVDLRLGGRIYVGQGLGGLSAAAGVILLERGPFLWTADLALTSDRPEDRADALAGMGDRGFGGFGGTTLALRVGPLEASAAIGLGLEGRMGMLGVLGLTAAHPLGGRWFGQLGGATVFGDCANLRWDFGVTERQAARRHALLAAGAPGLRPGDDVPYTPACGLREARTTGALIYALSPRVSLMGTATGVRLLRGAGDSPLTRERTSWEAGAGLAWRF